MKKNQDIKTLKRKTKEGFSLLIFREVIIKCIAFAGQFFLFRFLKPEDFGTFAILAFLINFFGIFTDLGLSTAIIQKNQEVSEDELSHAFYIMQLVTIIFVIVLWFAAPFIFKFYPKLSQNHILMFRIFIFTLLLRPLGSLLTALYEREINYNIISLIDISGIVSYQIVVVILAVKGFGVWSFIYAIYVKEVIELIVSFYNKPFFPKLTFHFKKTKKLFRFGFFMQLYSLQIFLHDAVSPVIVGRTLGPYFVGILDWSYSVASVSKYVTDNYGRVAFAAFARIQEEKEELEKFIDKSCVFLTIFGCFFTILLFSLGRDFIHFIFTDKWLPGLPSLYIYAFVILINTIVTPLASAVLALGKAKELIKLSACITIIEWISAFILIKSLGFIAVPIAALLAVTIAYIGFLYILRFNKVQFLFLTVMSRPVFSSIFVILCMAVINSLFPLSLSYLVVKGMLIVFLYSACLYLFSRKDLYETIYFIKSFFRSPL